jgi:uncharacterized protein YcfJ
MMKTINARTFLAAVATGFLAAPGVGSEYTTVREAEVVSSTPIIETVYESYQDCSGTALQKRSPSPYAERNNNVNQIIGGVVGGAVGSLAGKGSGKDAAAALGAVIGSEVLNPNNKGITEGEILGAVAGGVIGNQLGKGSGKTAATASGALIGKIAGGNIQENQNPSASGAAPAGYEQVRTCRTKEREKKVISGYTVKYLYDGSMFTDVLSYDPGNSVKIAVDVQAIEDLNR